MYIDHQACDAFWSAYVAQLPAEHAHRSLQPDVFGFGGEAELAEELALLVLAGKKRATTSLPSEFSSLGQRLPRAGDLSIIVRGNGLPAALLESTRVTCVAFGDVDSEYAAVEGEGDGSLAYWRQAHTEYFSGVCARLGGQLDDQTVVVCQVFRVIVAVPLGPRRS